MRAHVPARDRFVAAVTVDAEIGWKAQQRLTKRFRRLKSRQLQPNKICVAIARELAGFVWDIARQVRA